MLSSEISGFATLPIKINHSVLTKHFPNKSMDDSRVQCALYLVLSSSPLSPILSSIARYDEKRDQNNTFSVL